MGFIDWAAVLHDTLIDRANPMVGAVPRLRIYDNNQSHQIKS